ncbi:hypothetical protein JD844_004933 [Phrynosoma platyrhinos]|uniref:THD domain-containing protein n=1 Tax=Phrynosoma platyrhinos TaxID=52577 RepID=A0ABQ7SE00_PHRPL|nr:hypothetical protein JD844_004933 [Phrynosoma platyrhinos]
MKPRTHLAPAESQPNPNCMPGALPILHWRNDRTSGTDTITYNNGYMMVPEAGDYFVYTQITFFCPDGKCKDMTYCGRNVSEETSITQIISKLSSSYGSQPIQQLATSVYIGEKDKWKKTLYLGGVIQLRRHDKLMVNISNPTLVVTRSPEITFFGAFLI